MLVTCVKCLLTLCRVWTCAKYISIYMLENYIKGGSSVFGPKWYMCLHAYGSMSYLKKFDGKEQSSIYLEIPVIKIQVGFFICCCFRYVIDLFKFLKYNICYRTGMLILEKHKWLLNHQAKVYWLCWINSMQFFIMKKQ